MRCYVRRNGDSRCAIGTRALSDRGAALIETAITLPIILMICVGIFEFGRAYQTWQVLTNAAREGARVAVVGGTTDHEVESAVRAYMAAERLGNAAPRRSRSTARSPSAAQTGTQVTIQLSVRFHLARPGRALRQAGIHHGRTADDVSGRHHAERKLGERSCATESSPCSPSPCSRAADWRTAPTT